MPDKNNPNRSIQCKVVSCKNHCDRDDFCSLDCVCIGTHESDPAMNQCTDCQSFENICACEQERAIEQSQNKLYEHETNY